MKHPPLPTDESLRQGIRQRLGESSLLEEMTDTLYRKWQKGIYSRQEIQDMLPAAQDFCDACGKVTPWRHGKCQECTPEEIHV